MQPAAYPAARRMPPPMLRPTDMTAHNALRPAPPPCGVRGISPVYGGKGTRMAASVNRANTYASPARATRPASADAPSPAARGVWA